MFGKWQRTACMAVLVMEVMMVLPTNAADGERILRKIVEVRAPLADVWDAWTTAEGLKFISAKSRVELRVGGPYEWFLDLPPDPQGKRGGEGAQILAYLPREVLAFSWTLPPAVPSLRSQGAKTQAVVRFEERPDGIVVVRFAQLGWGEGADWDAGYAYFDKAWDQVLKQLKNKVGDKAR